MPFCLTDLCERCGCCIEIACVTHGCHETERPSLAADTVQPILLPNPLTVTVPP